MSTSLANFVNNLKKKQDFKILSKYFPKEKLELLTRKGVYPYDYVDSIVKFNEKNPS